MFSKFLKAFLGVVGIYLASKILIAISPALFVIVLIAGAIAYFTNWVDRACNFVCDWFESIVTDE